MKTRLLLLTILVLGLYPANRLASADEPLIIVAPGIAPISYEMNGQMTGIGTDLVSEAFARLGHSLRIQSFPAARAMNMIEKGEADVIFAIAKTPDREVFARYSNEPIIVQPIALFTRWDAAIPFDGKLENLSSRKIGIIRRGRFSPEFENALKNRLLPSCEEASEYGHNILKLVNRRIDVLIGPRLSVLFAAKELGLQKTIKELAPPLVFSSPGYTAFSRKGKALDLVTRFDETLKAMHRDGTYDRIVQSYLRQD